MADNVAEDGELAMGSNEEVKLPQRRSAFPKPTRSTTICRASYTSTSTVKPPIPIDTASSSTTSRKTRSPATSKVGRTNRESMARGKRRRRTPRIQVTWTKTLTPSTPPRATTRARTPSQGRPSLPHFPWHPHRPTTEDLSKDPDGHSPPSSPIPALVGGSNNLGQDGPHRPCAYGEPVRHGHQPID